jgi:membrane protein YqaA with SNARE-associated domain
MEFIALFWTSFASATLLPGGSEVLFLYLLNEKLNPFILFISATIGNTLGSFVNYLLGKYAVDFALRKNYMTQKHLQKATVLFDKYGAWTLLLSWLPIIGDPLTLVAGVAHYRWWKFLLIVGFAKMVRYVFVYAGFLAIF